MQKTIFNIHFFFTKTSNVYRNGQNSITKSCSKTSLNPHFTKSPTII